MTCGRVGVWAYRRASGRSGPEWTGVDAVGP